MFAQKAVLQQVTAALLQSVMELCEFGSVSDVLRKLQGPLKEQEIRIIAGEVLERLSAFDALPVRVASKGWGSWSSPFTELIKLTSFDIL
eukprot:s979_g24.t1